MTRNIVAKTADAELVIRSTVDRWTRLADELAEAGDTVGLGDGLVRLRALRQALSDLERHVEDHVTGLMDSKRVEIPGAVLVRHSGKKNTAWQSEDLLRHLIGDQVVDVRTGENVYQLLLAVLPINASLSWRKTALRELGIDVEDWSDEKPGRATVQIVKGDESVGGGNGAPGEPATGPVEPHETPPAHINEEG